MSAGSKARRQRPKPPKATGDFTVCQGSGKRGYATSDDAMVGATQIHNAEPVRAYLCEGCGRWHLTRQVRRGR